MKVILILGKSAAGKDFICENLLKNEAYYKAVSFTTRRKREKEVDGFDYYFISDEEFEGMDENHEFLETTSYNVGNEVWKYGYTMSSFDEKKTNIVVCNPEGYAKLYEKFHEIGARIKVIILTADEKIRKERYFKRDKNATDLQWKERLKQDEKDFFNFENKLLKQLNEGTCLSVANNSNDFKALEIIKSFIN